MHTVLEQIIRNWPEFDGNVEAPTGAFSVVEIPPVTQRGAGTWVAELIDAEQMGEYLSPALAAGWYFGTTNSDGVTSVAGPMTLDEAERMNAEFVQAFEAWDDEGED